MKTRKFADGGETDLDVEMANASDDPIAYMNKAKRWTDAEKTFAKPKVVTKEELAKSGLSLRDYMNKQQGLKRRRGASPTEDPTMGSAKSKAAQDAADAIDPSDIRTREIGRTRGSSSYNSAGKPSNAGPDVLSSNYSRNTRTGATTKMASGGPVSSRADGIAQRGKTRGKMC